MPPQLILFNKPFNVVCQFSPHPAHLTLADFIPISTVYPAGRLDTDSEGLVILTNHGKLQHTISHPTHKLLKSYWVQVEGVPPEEALNQLRYGINLGDFITQSAKVSVIAEPTLLWPRTPPIRFRQAIPTTWLEIAIKEGKNRQIRRMTAKIGYPTLRLIRFSIGQWNIVNLAPGAWRQAEIPSRFSEPGRLDN